MPIAELRRLRHIDPEFPKPVANIDGTEFFELADARKWRQWKFVQDAKHRPANAPDLMRPLDDEEVIDWWEAYDKGDSPEYIAFIFERPLKMVLKHLDELGAFEEHRHPRVERVGAIPNPKTTDKIPLDQDLIYRALHGQLNPRDQAIMEALARVRGGYDHDDRPEHQGVVKVFVRLHSNHRRTHRPMSARQRKQDEMAGSIWRQIVREDMAAAGIFPMRHRRLHKGRTR